MAHDGTNHPWYQGFTNIFGNMNQGFQNAMMPQTQNVTRQDFLADWFRQQGQIADNGFFDVQGFMSKNDAGEYIQIPRLTNQEIKQFYAEKNTADETSWSIQ